MYASIAVLLLCAVQFVSVSAAVGAAPANYNYNSKAFTGFIIAGGVVLLLFFVATIYFRNLAELEKIKDATRRAEAEQRDRAAAQSRGNSVASSHNKSESAR